MNQRIERAYENRPKNWVFEASVAVVFLALLVWSASAVETSGTTQNGGKIAVNILKGIFQQIGRASCRERVFRSV